MPTGRKTPTLTKPNQWTQDNIFSAVLDMVISVVVFLITGIGCVGAALTSIIKVKAEKCLASK